jgi:hypothetical protein
MSKAVAPVSAAVIPAIAPAKQAEATSLDPRILFSAICLAALVAAFAFGQPGIWL